MNAKVGRLALPFHLQQQVQRQRKAGTGFVDAHPERDGGADDSNAVFDPVVLNLRSVGSRNKLVSHNAHGTSKF